jgi:hypothetical protein
MRMRYGLSRRSPERIIEWNEEDQNRRNRFGFSRESADDSFSYQEQRRFATGAEKVLIRDREGLYQEQRRFVSGTEMTAEI